MKKVKVVTQTVGPVTGETIERGEEMNQCMTAREVENRRDENELVVLRSLLRDLTTRIDMLELRLQSKGVL